MMIPCKCSYGKIPLVELPYIQYIFISEFMSIQKLHTRQFYQIVIIIT